jgi:hypothetical protein
VTINAAIAMQNLINLVYQYSVWWRFKFNTDKCGVVVFGETEIERAFRNPFVLGDIVLKEKKEYKHVGILTYNDQECILNNMCNNVSNMKKAFYSAIGCAISKSTLTPSSMSTIYWSVSISKLLYGCEIRYFPYEELELYEKQHRVMAKSILRLPINSPDGQILSAYLF